MIEVSIVHQVLDFVSVFLAGMSIGISISGLMRLRVKKSKKQIDDRDYKASRSDK